MFAVDRWVIHGQVRDRGRREGVFDSHRVLNRFPQALDTATHRADERGFGTGSLCDATGRSARLLRILREACQHSAGMVLTPSRQRYPDHNLAAHGSYVPTRAGDQSDRLLHGPDLERHRPIHEIRAGGVSHPELHDPAHVDSGRSGVPLPGGATTSDGHRSSGYSQVPVGGSRVLRVFDTAVYRRAWPGRPWRT